MPPRWAASIAASAAGGSRRVVLQARRDGAADSDRRLGLLPAPMDDDRQLLRLGREEIDRPQRRPGHEGFAAVAAGKTPAPMPSGFELMTRTPYLYRTCTSAVARPVWSNSTQMPLPKMKVGGFGPLRAVRAHAPTRSGGGVAHTRGRRAEAQPGVLAVGCRDTPRDFDIWDRIGRLVDAPRLGTIGAVGRFDLGGRRRLEPDRRHRAAEADVEEAQALQREPPRARGAARLDADSVAGGLRLGTKKASSQASVAVS